MAVKHVFTIPPDTAFADALAEGLLREAGGDTFKLSEALILLPTRRACRHLREAFLRHGGGKAMLLPRMQPIGDLDEDELYFTDAEIDAAMPPAIAPVRRQLLLARLIAGKNPGMPLDQAAQLAEALARFLDEVQIEQLGFSSLETLVKEQDLAAHWQETVVFLQILTKEWPKILGDEGCIDPAERRNRVLAAQAAAWRAKAPNYRVIAAGSTGSMPATAELLDVIAGLPQGAVILPGLDQAMDEESWQEVTETHPQYGLKQLLEKLGVKRSDVRRWNDGTEKISSRVRLLQESMRPAEVSEAWQKLKPADIPREALQGLARLELDHPQEEARAIALLLHEALETPRKTATLVTPDRALAERVSALLARWGIEANDSGGTPLAALPIGGFLLDILAAAAPDATPVDDLSLLKHPFAACGLSPAECRSHARQVEMDLWRDTRKKERKADSKKWFRQFKDSLKPVSDTWNKPLPLAAHLQTHIKLAEQIATTDDTAGSDRIWQGEAGEAAAAWLDEWQNAAHDFLPLTGADYAELFAGFLRSITMRPRFGLHPRISILGPLETRLIHADRVILGGMNEGSWPPDTGVDPWMSRPMKKAFGLPLPERRIGLSAHDFVQLASAPEVFLTRARRSGNTPTVPSRFLLQLDAVLRALDYTIGKQDALEAALPWKEWARMLDEPEQIKPCERPNPKPPSDQRPKELSVTDIGTWQRNPYAIYARHVLKLRPLDPLEDEIDAAERGSMIHKALDEFIKQHPADLPPNALPKLMEIGRKIFTEYEEHPQAKAFWWPRFERIAAWFVDNERAQRARGIMPVKAEAEGHISLNGFGLKGRADRIDRMPDGALAITDYKTGGVPKVKEVEAGYEPQLPLLALIAAEGGFAGVPAGETSTLAYWKLGGGREAAKIQTLKEDATTLRENARDRLEQLVKAFADPAMPYQAVPKPGLQPRYDKYAHLARLQEWGRTEEEV
ncbi:MAG: double-strand break repair protein AddB [Alphaproteobacteria bacterium]|nr:double-strand break repair protein AddB [Alphaproteobacteria bacterium]